MTKHQQVHIEFRGPLQDSAGDIVLRCTHDLAVRIDACGGQPVDQSLDRLAVRAFDVLVGGAHAEARATDDVTRDDVPARHVKDVHRRTRQPSDLFGPRLRRSVLFSRRGVDRYRIRSYMVLPPISGRRGDCGGNLVRTSLRRWLDAHRVQFERATGDRHQQRQHDTQKA